MASVHDRMAPARLTILIGIALALAPAILAHEPAPPLRGGAEIGYPPFSFAGSDGLPTGFSVDLMREAARAMGRRIDYRLDTWEEVKTQLAKGEIDALPVVGRTPEREKVFDFTAPYLSMHGAIVVRRGSSIRSFGDLHGRTVAVMKGDNAEEFLRREPRPFAIRTTPTFEEALRQLSTGRHDAVMVQTLVGLRLIQQHGFSNLQVLDGVVPGFRQDWCFAVRNGDTETLALLGEGLALVSTNGTYRRLHAQWFGSSDVRPNKRLVIGGDANFPPYEYLDERGRPAGYNIDVMRAIGAELGLELEFRLAPWTEVMRQMEAGEIDVLGGMFYSAERDLHFEFSTPHAVIHHILVGRSGARFPDSFAELEGRRVAVERGDICDETLRREATGAQIIRTVNQEQALASVVSGAADFALVARLPAAQWIREHGWNTLQASDNSLFSGEYGIAVADHQKSLLAQLDEGLRLLQQNGGLRRIQSRWFGAYASSFWNPATIRYATVAVAVVLVLFCSVLLWLRALRRLVASRTAELAQSEARVRAVFEASPVAMLVGDATGRFVYVNAAAVLHYGYTREEMLQMKQGSIVPEQQRAWELSLWTDSVDLGPIYESRRITRSGEEIPVEVHARMLWFDGQRCVLTVETDLRERKRVEEEREALSSKLQQSQRIEAVGRLAGGIAHDFNNLLQGILGFAEILRRSLPPEDRLQSHVSEIAKAGESAAALTNQLLAFSRKQIIEPRVVELNSIVEKSRNLLARLIGEHISFELQLEPFLWRTRVDPAQAEQILVNLAVNARDAMPERGRLVLSTENVTMDEPFCRSHEGALPGEYVVLAVRDTGCGIAPELLERIFEPFFTTKPLGKGTGLGLSTVYGIVKQHGGFLWVESQQGAGATFRVALPRTLEEVPLPSGVVNDSAAKSDGTILLAEDQPAVRLLAATILRESGYRVIEAENGADALAKAQAALADIDLLLTDLVMPELDGRQLYESLARARPELPVVFMSGHNDDVVATHGVLEGGTLLLKKPFQNQQLLARVREAIVGVETPRSGAPRRPILLLVDDDETVRLGLTLTLEAEGYGVVEASSCSEARAAVAASGTVFDLAVIDHTLPDGDGVSLSGELLRTDATFAVLLVSGAPPSQEAGALLAHPARCAFLQKPFTVDELGRVARRLTGHLSVAEPTGTTR